MKKEESALLINRVLSLIDAMDDKDFKDWLNGKAEFVIIRADTAAFVQNRTVRTKAEPVAPADFTELIGQLTSASSEEEAQNILSSSRQVKTNRDLLQLGQQLKANVNSRQRKPELIQAIIKAAVGRRLQTETLFRVTAEG